VVSASSLYLYQTCAIFPTSQAYNAAESIPGHDTDQRGAVRPCKGAVDVGAYEWTGIQNSLQCQGKILIETKGDVCVLTVENNTNRRSCSQHSRTQTSQEVQEGTTQDQVKDSQETLDLDGQRRIQSLLAYHDGDLDARCSRSRHSEILLRLLKV